MRKQNWPKRDPIKNYFPLPNEIYDLGLSRGAISVYSFLLRREDRKTYQCLLSYRDEYSARDCAPQPLKLSIHSGGIEHPCRCR